MQDDPVRPWSHRLRSLWLPSLLALLALSHAAATAVHLAKGQPRSRLRIDWRSDDSLTALAAGLWGGWARRYGHYVALEAVLGGSTLAAPAGLDLNAGDLANVARIRLVRGAAPALGAGPARRLEAEAGEPLLLPPWHVYVVDGRERPRPERLLLVPHVRAPRLYVISAARLAAIERGER